MIQSLLSFYSPRYPSVLAYLLQDSKYKLGPYLKWLIRTDNFNEVLKKHKYTPTYSSLVILQILRLGIGLELTSGVVLIVLGLNGKLPGGVYFGLADIIAYPLVWAILVAIFVFLGWIVSRLNFR